MLMLPVNYANGPSLLLDGRLWNLPFILQHSLKKSATQKLQSGYLAFRVYKCTKLGPFPVLAPFGVQADGGMMETIVGSMPLLLWRFGIKGPQRPLLGVPECIPPAVGWAILQFCTSYFSRSA